MADETLAAGEEESFVWVGWCAHTITTGDGSNHDDRPMKGTTRGTTLQNTTAMTLKSQRPLPKDRHIVGAQISFFVFRPPESH